MWLLSLVVLSRTRELQVDSNRNSTANQNLQSNGKCLIITYNLQSYGKCLIITYNLQSNGKCLIITYNLQSNGKW